MVAVQSILTIIGQVLVLLGLLITGFGVYAVLKLESFYARSVVTSKVEAMGFLTVILGAMLISGFSLVALKLLILLAFELLTVSAGTHAITRSAWITGYRCRTVISIDHREEQAHDR